MLARVRTTPTMALVIGDLLPKLGATHDDLQRQGAIEALACVIDSLGLGVVPYIVFLVVPTLGRMSDTDDAVRLMATHCFAALVRLMPLDVSSQPSSTIVGIVILVPMRTRQTSNKLDKRRCLCCVG